MVLCRVLWWDYWVPISNIRYDRGLIKYYSSVQAIPLKIRKPTPMLKVFKEKILLLKIMDA